MLYDFRQESVKPIISLPLFTDFFRIIRGSLEFGRLLIPEPQNRIPITPANFLLTLSYVPPFLFLAYLSRQPGTYLIRLLLLPTVITVALASGFRYCWTIPALNVSSSRKRTFEIANYIIVRFIIGDKVRYLSSILWYPC